MRVNSNIQWAKLSLSMWTQHGQSVKMWEVFTVFEKVDTFIYGITTNLTISSTHLEFTTNMFMDGPLVKRFAVKLHRSYWSRLVEFSGDLHLYWAVAQKIVSPWPWHGGDQPPNRRTMLSVQSVFGIIILCCWCCCCVTFSYCFSRCVCACVREILRAQGSLYPQRHRYCTARFNFWVQRNQLEGLSWEIDKPFFQKSLIEVKRRIVVSLFFVVQIENRFL